MGSERQDSGGLREVLEKSQKILWGPQGHFKRSQGVPGEFQRVSA